MSVQINNLNYNNVINLNLDNIDELTICLVQPSSTVSNNIGPFCIYDNVNKQGIIYISNKDTILNEYVLYYNSYYRNNMPFSSEVFNLVGTEVNFTFKFNQTQGFIHTTNGSKLPDNGYYIFKLV